MKIVPYKENGKEVQDRYLVVVPSLFGDAVLFGPASLADCQGYVLSKMKELANDLAQQIKIEQEKQALQQASQKVKSKGFER
ncbi:MAG: hypothetical protein Q7T29_05050 [Gallionella sp.]|nr:hypothetical protein [Gallionella sp.]